MSVVKRSKAASAKSHIKAAMGAVSVDLQVTSADELSLELVIDKVRKIPGVEGENVNESNEVNVANFMKALEEEANAAAGFFGDAEGEPEPAGKGRPAADVVAEIRKRGGVNWALFSVL